MVDLIHADSTLREIGVILDFNQYDAVAALSTTDEESDWMLELPTEVYTADPILCGDYVYIDGTEFGGPCERVRHSSADGTVKLYGALWRGVLRRRIICPDPGDTHFVISKLSGSQALEAMLGSWNQNFMQVSRIADGLSVSASVRYRPFAEAAEAALADAGGRLALTFRDGTLTLAAESIRDLSADIELSDEYSCTLISDRRSAVYNHILALGRGEMLDRQIVELWLLPDGTVTADPSLANGLEENTLLYDYTFAETAEELEEAAKSKLLEYASSGSMEFEFTDDTIDLGLCDQVCVGDYVTGTSNVMSVVKKRITITETGLSIRHILA